MDEGGRECNGGDDDDELKAPYNEVAVARQLVLLQQRLPVFDGAVDLVQCGQVVNRWIPLAAMEFLLRWSERIVGWASMGPRSVVVVVVEQGGGGDCLSAIILAGF